MGLRYVVGGLAALVFLGMLSCAALIAMLARRHPDTITLLNDDPGRSSATSRVSR
jgi:hypothetical protein